MLPERSSSTHSSTGALSCCTSASLVCTEATGQASAKTNSGPRRLPMWALTGSPRLMWLKSAGRGNGVRLFEGQKEPAHRSAR